MKIKEKRFLATKAMVVCVCEFDLYLSVALAYPKDFYIGYKFYKN